ncbi:MAG: hypothetical protein LC732_08105 [Acidobacteria bacterium]|nr:hypothetical protein [Acidobacteriota bacterium]
MKVRLVAAAWIAGATLPLLGAAAYCFACCVLPFHGTLHDLMPGCEMAARLTGNGAEDHDRKAQPSTAPEKQEPAKRLAADPTSRAPILVVSHHQSPLASSAKPAYRSFITLGAVRCDQDVGLHVLVKTFLI